MSLKWPRTDPRILVGLSEAVTTKAGAAIHHASND
jgi:hypothetical protein